METRAPEGFSGVELIGRGATSHVYRATELASGREVALKRLHRHLVRSAEALARLRRELDALGRLRHRALVPVYDVFRWDGDPTLVLELVPGEDLKERVTRLGRLPPGEVLAIARALLDVLALVHGSGIVHRDLKPQNVRLAPEGRVVLLDFGSARLDAASALTVTGTTVGTPEYMAPELFAGPVYDPRVDLYGLGATLFEALTGRPPQQADSLAELAGLRTREDAPPVRSLAPDTPLGLATLVDRCLARSPDDRPASTAAALVALDHPEVAQAWAARRSCRPPCLACLAPIPPESTTCPACGAVPFSYEPGPWHVNLRGVADAAPFVEHVATLFPEHAGPDARLALAERCAALSDGPERYVSFVSRTAADRVVGQLAQVGARTEVVTDPGAWFRLLALIGGLFGVLAFFAGSPSGVLLAAPFLLERALRMRQAAAGVLGPGERKPLAPALDLLAMGGLALAGLWLSSAILGCGSAPIPMTFGRNGALGPISMGGAMLVALVLLARCAYQRAPGLSSPEASFWVKVRQAGEASSPRDLGEGRGRPAEIDGIYIFVTLWVLGIFELMAIGHAFDWFGLGGSRATADLTLVAPFFGSDLLAPVSRAWASGEIVVAFPGVAILAASLVVLRRHRRIRREAARTFAELDPALFGRLGARTVPARTRGAVAAALPRPPHTDAFVAAGARRAAELAPLLPEGALAALEAQLEELDRRSGERRADASLLARCLLETDPDQQARFDFLALEGRLEAQAALAWASRARGR